MCDRLGFSGEGWVSAHEGKAMEFKRDLSSLTKPLQTIVVFANSAGRRLVIGVNDHGTVAGVADPLAKGQEGAE
ncbi:MAG: ATP-binding protein [Acidipropionibacterium sp.]|jgi:predicted HTH transcriptional regulator|nr:ATP-binding protein [Acidipropionibacterium sp.]